MQRRLAWVLALCLGAFVSVGAPSARAEAPTLAALHAQTKDSVVLLLVVDSSGNKSRGTGFFVSPGGRIVTNHHVIAGAVDVKAKLSDGREVGIVGLVADDPDKDVAVVQAEPGAYPPLPLGVSEGLKPGDEVFVVGSPLGLAGTLSSGIVAAIRDGELAERVGEELQGWSLQITAAVSPGSSGSPVMTKDGKVVGVAVGIVGPQTAQGLNFAVRIEEASRLLAGIEDKKTPQSFHRGSQLARNLAMSAAVIAVLGFFGFFLTRAPKKKSGLS